MQHKNLGFLLSFAAAGALAAIVVGLAIVFVPMAVPTAVMMAGVYCLTIGLGTLFATGLASFLLVRYGNTEKNRIEQPCDHQDSKESSGGVSSFFQGAYKSIFGTEASIRNQVVLPN